MSIKMKEAKDAGLPKLVRSEVPDLILSEGRTCTYRVAKGEEVLQLLRGKLEEEIEELFDSWGLKKGPDDEEIIDVIDVLKAIYNFKPCTKGHNPCLEDAMQVKLQNKGSFDKFYVLEDYGPAPEKP